jgi:hypothetical protein
LRPASSAASEAWTPTPPNSIHGLHFEPSNGINGTRQEAPWGAAQKVNSLSIFANPFTGSLLWRKAENCERWLWEADVFANFNVHAKSRACKVELIEGIAGCNCTRKTRQKATLSQQTNQATSNPISHNRRS